MRRMFRGVRTLVFASGIFVLVPHAAGAQNIDPATLSTARTLGYAGVDAFQHGDYAGAAEKLEKALRVFEAPSLGLWSARALDKLGRVVEAAERYRSVARMKPGTGEEDVQRKAQNDAATELQALLPRIPRMVVVLERAPSAGVSLALDDGAFQPVSAGEIFPMNPGNHRLVGRSERQVVEQTFTLRESEQRQITLRFGGSETAGNTSAIVGATAIAPESTPMERESGSTQKTLGWVSVGIGGAAVLTGALTGLIAVGKRSSLDGSENCHLDVNQCTTSEQDGVDSYNRMRTISSIGFIAGGIVAAGGGVLLLTMPKSERQVAVRLGPRGFAFAGEF